jgi:DNA repair protein RecO (recombination protein O)
MENWQDQGIVLSVRAHGESGAVVSLLTENNGRHAGYVRGISSSKNRGIIEPGNLVSAAWSSRVTDQLGAFVIEPMRSITAPLMSDPLRFGALISACSLCDAALPEREGHPGLFHGLLALLETLDGEAWGAVYIMWEIAFMRELGFGLELHKCVAGGDTSTLAYVSPKSGRAVSEEKAEPYRDKLLPLPDFLKPGGSSIDHAEIIRGLELTGHFLEHWVFAQHTKGVPEPRLMFQERMQKFSQAA